jgi:hypothetical protein
MKNTRMAPQKTEASLRSSLRIAAGVIGLVCTAFLLAPLWFDKTQNSPSPSGTSQNDESAVDQITDAQPSDSTEVNKASSATEPTTPAAVSTQSAALRREPTRETQALVNSLVRLELQNGALTREQVADWKSSFQKLIQNGPSAVPAIREFLSSNTELDFGAGSRQWLGYVSARNAMVGALMEIGGPEAVSALQQTLQTATDPTEIAILAQDLDKLQPEQHRVEAVEAARQVLEIAGTRKLETKDVAPLFELLGNYGGAGAVPDLQKAATQWSYYAPMALGLLPEGAGIPSLVQLVQDDHTSVCTRDTALQMLAQASDQSREAYDVLIEQARLGAISEFGWRLMGLVLSGDRVGYLHSAFEDAEEINQQTGVRTTSTSDNQHFYSVPASLTPVQAQQRTRLIDELLIATKSPTAVDVLVESKASLSRHIAQVGLVTAGQ